MRKSRLIALFLVIGMALSGRVMLTAAEISGHSQENRPPSGETSRLLSPEFPGESRGNLVMEGKMGIYGEDLVYLKNELDNLFQETK